MRHLAKLLLAILACALAVPASAQAITRAADLRAEAHAAQDAGVPLVIFFSEQHCPYCERARRDHLVPLTADPTAGARLKLVEVDIRSDAPLESFSGTRTTHSAFAAANRVKWVPTLMFAGANGNALAEPLIGLTVPDLYQGLLERRLEQATEKLRRP
ncbi:MAG: thioredoxin [Betaproteobacteria bacterium]|nr:thioredoxin [Betaproteobacteria bacterium]